MESVKVCVCSNEQMRGVAKFDRIAISAQNNQTSVSFEFKPRPRRVSGKAGKDEHALLGFRMSAMRSWQVLTRCNTCIETSAGSSGAQATAQREGRKT